MKKRAWAANCGKVAKLMLKRLDAPSATVVLVGAQSVRRKCQQFKGHTSKEWNKNGRGRVLGALRLRPQPSPPQRTKLGRASRRPGGGSGKAFVEILSKPIGLSMVVQVSANATLSLGAGMTHPRVRGFLIQWTMISVGRCSLYVHRTGGAGAPCVFLLHNVATP